MNGGNLKTTQGIDKLDLIEDRLYALRTEARKHNCTVDDLITIRNKLKTSLSDIKDNNFKGVGCTLVLLHYYIQYHLI